ncbi:MAG TPA: flagellar basal-body MS-ring/collar protein FliF [Gaiellales bacterium]|jgi:flagellar M-ring protein FliF|nr:flagellar basal-body MS-ring/collar protein FliF [Gaiellales bacterium]
MNLTSLRETWNGIETRSQLTLVASLLGALGMLFLLYTFATRPSYSTLASNLAPAETAKAENALGAAGIAYKTGNGGTQISVVSGKEAAARVALAQKGVLNGSHVGFELFDKTSLGATDFQQTVNYQRALEGEIASTIEQIQGVSSATVQLVLPDATIFADEQSKATAGVLVDGGSNLDEATIRGIAHLTAASVKNLDAQDVTITDETGALLWPTSSGGSGLTAQGKLQADALYAAQLTSQINGLLTATLGPGKATARVHADLNADQTTIDKTTYAKKGVPLTQQTGVESLKSKGGAAAVPAGTSTNTTPSYAATASGNGQSQYSHKTGSTTFGVDKTVQRSIVAPGTINQLDLALVVDKSVPAAQVASLRKSVASMAGITPSRGDTFAVSRVAFAKPPAAATTPSPISGLMSDPMSLARPGLIGLASLVFLFLMRRTIKRREGDASVAEPTWLREIESGTRTVAELESAGDRAVLPARVRAQQSTIRDQVDEIVREQPKAVANQVAAWMKE